jgi:hypothetical protein
VQPDSACGSLSERARQKTQSLRKTLKVGAVTQAAVDEVE